MVGSVIEKRSLGDVLDVMGTVRSAILGAVVIASIDNGLGLLNVSAGTKYVATGRTVISGGGKIMTTTAKGTAADGKPFTSTYVFDKQ